MRRSWALHASRLASFKTSKPKKGLVHRYIWTVTGPFFGSPQNPRWSRRRAWKSAAIITGCIAVAGLYDYYKAYDDGIPLRPDVFTPFTLVARKAVSPTSSLFTLRPRTKEPTFAVYAEAWEKGVWSIQVKQPQLQIARSYTPLPPTGLAPKSEPGDLEFLIRRDPQGEVSRYLHKLPPGARIDLRGPQLEYAIPQNVDEVLFLAGGTGIAPALQVVHTLQKVRSLSTSRTPRIHILWANRRQEDTLPVLKELNSSSQEELSLQYFVDDEKTFINKDVLTRCLLKFSEKGRNALESDPAGRKLILISGPEGFVNYYAGPKVWKGGLERQGPLGGLLKNLKLDGWEVWKL